jgi:hypothetical protein
MRRGSFIAILVGAALIVGGCGGDGSGDATAGQGVAESVTVSDDLSRAELILEGDKICTQTDKTQEAQLEAFLKDHPNSQSNPKGQAKLVREAGLPPIREELEELAALGAPPGDEKQVEAILEALETAIEKSEDDPASLLKDEDNLFGKVGELAATYGFGACQKPL